MSNEVDISREAVAARIERARRFAASAKMLFDAKEFTAHVSEDSQ